MKKVCQNYKFLIKLLSKTFVDASQQSQSTNASTSRSNEEMEKQMKGNNKRIQESAAFPDLVSRTRNLNSIFLSNKRAKRVQKSAESRENEKQKRLSINKDELPFSLSAPLPLETASDQNQDLGFAEYFNHFSDGISSVEKEYGVPEVYMKPPTNIEQNRLLSLSSCSTSKAKHVQGRHVVAHQKMSDSVVEEELDLGIPSRIDASEGLESSEPRMEHSNLRPEMNETLTQKDTKSKDHFNSLTHNLLPPSFVVSTKKKAVRRAKVDAAKKRIEVLKISLKNEIEKLKKCSNTDSNTILNDALHENDLETKNPSDKIIHETAPSNTKDFRNQGTIPIHGINEYSSIDEEDILIQKFILQGVSEEEIIEGHYSCIESRILERSLKKQMMEATNPEAKTGQSREAKGISASGTIPLEYGEIEISDEEISSYCRTPQEIKLMKSIFGMLQP